MLSQNLNVKAIKKLKLNDKVLFLGLQKCPEKFYQAIAKMDKDGLLLEGNSELNLIDSNFITEKQTFKM